MKNALNDFLETVNPDLNKLKKDKEGTIKSKIVDIEHDLIDVSFDDDNCVRIDTEDYKYITLSIDMLYQLAEMIVDAERMYEEK